MWATARVRQRPVRHLILLAQEPMATPPASAIDLAFELVLMLAARARTGRAVCAPVQFAHRDGVWLEAQAGRADLRIDAQLAVTCELPLTSPEQAEVSALF